MTVQELLVNIKNKEFNLKKELKAKKYLPIKDKRKLAVGVIAACTDDLDDFISVDRFKLNIYFDMKVLATYTNLEVAADFDGMIEEYDALCEKGILKKIIALFIDDYAAVYKILEDELESLLVQNSIDAQVVKIANKINKAIDGIGDALGAIDLNDILPDGLNVDNLTNMLNVLK